MSGGQQWTGGQHALVHPLNALAVAVVKTYSRRHYGHGEDEGAQLPKQKHCIQHDSLQITRLA
jgi:hypothetical protein